jgi:hypothetical protein
VGTASGTITADPRFVNYKADGTGDYHLTDTSAAINKGLLAYAPSTDLDGNSRLPGPGCDIGAYEYGAGASVEAATHGVEPGLLAAKPNPFNGVLHVSLNGAMNQAVSVLTVYDVRGKAVHQAGFVSGMYSWKPEGLPNGAYLIRVRTASGRICETRNLLLK